MPAPFCDPELNPPYGNCCILGYNDPYHEYAAVGLGPFGQTGTMAVCNYNQYCYDDAVSCFGSCPSSGPGAQACNQGCRHRLMHCCDKTPGTEYENNSNAGSICGEGAIGDEELQGYYECTCGSTAVFMPDGGGPPKMRPPLATFEKQPNQPLSGQHNQSHPPGGYAQNRLRKNMNKTSKCGPNEMRLPNGRCQRTKSKQIVALDNGNGDVVMDYGYDCCSSQCTDFYARVSCGTQTVTCMLPQGCSQLNYSENWWNQNLNDLLFGDYSNSQYQYGETFVTTSYEFEQVNGGGLSCYGGCSYSGGDLRSACLGTGASGYSAYNNQSVCGQVVRCNCKCYADCGASIIADEETSFGGSKGPF